jgi:hypothetical protein
VQVLQGLVYFRKERNLEMFKSLLKKLFSPTKTVRSSEYTEKANVQTLMTVRKMIDRCITKIEEGEKIDVNYVLTRNMVPFTNVYREREFRPVGPVETNIIIKDWGNDEKENNQKDN